MALAMPGAEEKAHFGQADFRVKNKVFAVLAPGGERATVKMDPEAQAILVDAKPKAFVPAPGAWGRRGYTFVYLAHVTVKELRPLIVESWRLTAPKKLVAEHDRAE